ncbi:podoplanin isoform X2 [Lemur catta]|uniref:podoplanin isoform X2 n=1 Tax=Lemur catta TaxID=9447 RepID=UPI001E267E81|nr:podoplanin isoform X2 [Lemur catta]
MLTRPGVLRCQVRPAAAPRPARPGSSRAPLRRAAPAGLWPRSCFVCPQLRSQPLGPRERRSAGKMWKVPVLLFVLGSASLWVPAGGASTSRPEDDIETPGVEAGLVTPGAEDVASPGVEDLTTPGATEEPSKPAGPTTPVAKSTTSRDIEDRPTLGSTGHAKEESQSTTVPNVATSHSTDKAGGETRVTIDKDGLTTVTLVGIIVGVLLAIGFLGGIILVVMRKMSGRP